MRVVRTEMYFDGRFIRHTGRARPMGNVSVAFIQGAQEYEIESAYRITDNQVSKLLDRILRDQRQHARHPERIQEVLFGSSPVLNHDIVETVLNGDIVVEDSPPRWEKLYELVRKGATNVGPYGLAGYVSVTGDWMMLIKLPAAVVVISTADALTKWIKKNLPKIMDHATRGLRRR